MRLKDVTSAAGLHLNIKIGGGEARIQMMESPYQHALATSVA
jgi:hypothetical protein